MSFDAREIFANFAEKEKIKGHHSPEGRAIRVLSRALNGWVGGNLSSRDVIVLCNQAMLDWLKARLRRSPWSGNLVALIAEALQKELISRAEALRLQKVHSLRARADGSRPIARREVEAALEFCLKLIEKHW